MTSTNKGIRNAATLIICCGLKNVNKNNYNYKVMLLKRSAKLRVAPERHVFPGGAYEPSDASLKWLDVFFQNQRNNHKININDYFTSILITKNNKFNVKRPYLFSQKYNECNQLPPEIAYRLCALRETFEETGLLIAFNNKNGESLVNNKPKQFSGYVLDKDLMKWRDKIRGNTDEFINMFLEFNLTPDIFALHEWSSWLTPSAMKSGSFNTVFFTCFINEKPEEASFDINKDESQALEFNEPTEALKRYDKKEISFLPPQIYELTRLSGFRLIEKLAEYSLNRQSKGGIRTWQPRFVQIKEQTFGLLPGDDYYNLAEITDETLNKHHVVNKNRFFKNTNR